MSSRLSLQLYELLFNYLKNDCKQMPSKELLMREMSQTIKINAKKSMKSIRKKFIKWSERMKLSNGFLLHKTSNKIIIPEIEFQNVIKKIHESNDQHFSYSQTIGQK